VLEAFPDRAASPDVAFRVAGWFWATRKARISDRESEALALNTLADLAARQLQRDQRHPMERSYFQDITRAINGGLNGADDRWRRYLRCCEVLGVTTSTAHPA
jgi:putative chitinase